MSYGFGSSGKVAGIVNYYVILLYLYYIYYII